VAVVGVGIDVVDISRFDDALRRTPGLVDRLFTPAEAALAVASLAARFAAKEALAKALGAPGNLDWHDAEVVTQSSGQPLFTLRGTVAARAAEVGATSVHLSLSHDAGIASAMVVLES
jgi:holo-[acyl-carrier protein] synthase